MVERREREREWKGVRKGRRRKKEHSEDDRKNEEREWKGERKGKGRMK